MSRREGGLGAIVVGCCNTVWMGSGLCAPVPYLSYFVWVIRGGGGGTCAVHGHDTNYRMGLSFRARGLSTGIVWGRCHVGVLCLRRR
ncbi:uncharacterized protein BO66DRAFT_188955 [Aspergillus aculeatinus CBS 121060]|uniref:Uncharacterized protein n=1 Tax=Aspergillus aculeatinus CBS 121060 TaxID=1448322 RepID=A0ACD1GXT6_9EURO|nr:hypothetical protein BO66DRAFT_188955 [Aspergillus aculeatinus CBS 121060]RAH66160.1 hypothetical protein BO66DRAFT_188955 [Aspergillus aculeatinus CBS 121060]